MIRRAFIAGLGSAAAWPLAARAQRQTVWRVGYLSPGLAALDAANVEAFRHRMKDLGYIEGKNLIIEARFAEGQWDRLPALASDLISLQCDVIVARATPAIAAAQRATSTIPIVMSPSTDPIGSGFVKSFPRPGGNITGVANLYGDMTAKSFEVLHIVLPDAKTIAALMSSNPTHPSLYERAREAAESLALSAVRILAPRSDDLERAFQEMRSEKCDALFVLGDLAGAFKISAVYQFSLFVDAGGLASYGANLPAMSSLAAMYVDKILKGADPAEFLLRLNLS